MERMIVLDRDHYARGRADGVWIFSGQDNGRSVRIAIADRDWTAIEREAGGFDAALTAVERLAMGSARTVEDGFGGYLVMVGDAGEACGRVPDSIHHHRTRTPS